MRTVSRYREFRISFNITLGDKYVSCYLKNDALPGNASYRALNIERGTDCVFGLLKY
jgi:hypothetical protein